MRSRFVSKKMAVIKTLSQFGQTTSLKGISRSVKSTHKCLRILWIVGFFLGLVAGIYQLSAIISLYLSHPVVTESKQGSPGSTTFPDVTLCNLNPTSNEAKQILTYDGYISSFAGLFDTVVPIVAEDLPWNGGGDSSEEGSFERGGNYNPVINSQHSGRNRDKLDLTAREIEELKGNLQSVSGYFQNLPTSQHMNASKTDFILKCTFHDWDWSIVDLDCTQTSKGGTISVKFIPNYFACYTISVPDEYKTKIRGVSIVLHLDNFQNIVLPSNTYYEPDLLHSKAEGARLAVHARHTLPNIKEGITVSPGHETTVRMSQTHRKLIPEPFSNCSYRELLDDVDDNQNNSIKSDMAFKFSYSQEACEELCLQDNIIGDCTCITPYLAFLPRHVRIVNFCAYLNATLKSSTAPRGDLFDGGDGGERLGPGGVEGNSRQAVARDDNDAMVTQETSLEENSTELESEEMSTRVPGSGVESGTGRGGEGSGPGEESVPETETELESEEDTSEDFEPDFNRSPRNLIEFVVDETKVKTVLARMQCAHNSMNSHRNSDRCTKKCPSQCEEDLYDIKISQSPWPVAAYHLAFYGRFIENSPFKHKYNETYEPIVAASRIAYADEVVKDMIAGERAAIHTNFLQVNVLMENERVMLLKDVEKISWESMFGSLGGLMNLWIGITFFTLIELVELVFSLFRGSIISHIPGGGSTGRQVKVAPHATATCMAKVS